MRMKIQKIDITPEKILDLLRDNFIFIIIVGIITFLFDYKDVFKGPDEFYYNLFFGLALLLSLIIFKKHRNPFYYSPSYIFFVKDRNDPIVKLEPLLDPLLTKLGLVRYDDFVNIRYRLYPDLPTGLELNPNTGLISGFPMEVGNHTSEVKMRFLGGEYSTNIRIEVANTLKEKMVVPERGEFAPPRTVAQLLLREEDVLKREQDLDYSLSQEREVFEKEYNLKELSLISDFDSVKGKFSKDQAEVKKTYELKIDQKNSIINDLREEMETKLRELEFNKTQNMDEVQNDMSNKLKELEIAKDLKIEELEAEMVSALQAKEREFVNFEKEIKFKFEDKERELEENYKLREVVVEEPVEEEPEEVVVEEPVEEEPEEVVVEEPVEEEPDEVVVEKSDYNSMTKAKLIELAKGQGLSTSGTKKKIISRLEEI
jgi:hypothetical protein